jgi:hypothetical protein
MTSGALRFALSADIDRWRVQRNEQREHFACKTLVERGCAAMTSSSGWGATTSTRVFSIALSLVGIKCKQVEVDGCDVALG